MIKELWVARDKNGNVWQFDTKPEFDESDGIYRNNRVDGRYVKYNTFDITLKPLECVKVTIDTLEQSYKKVPIREDGFYTATNNAGDITWILESKNDSWYFYNGGTADIDNMKVGTKPIPKECLP